jgi:hypothetical protein
MRGGGDAPGGSPTSWVFPSLSSPQIPHSSGVCFVRVDKGRGCEARRQMEEDGDVGC